MFDPDPHSIYYYPKHAYLNPSRYPQARALDGSPTDSGHEDVGHPHGPSRHDQPSRELFIADHSQEVPSAPDGHNRSRSNPHKGHSWGTQHAISGQYESHGSSYSYDPMETDGGNNGEGGRRGGMSRGPGNAYDQESGHWWGEAPARKPLCVVCKKRPQYARGPIRYNTCGLTCGDILKARGGAGRSGLRQICVVCGIRPQHAPYLTCGLTCAAKLQESSNTWRDPGCSLDFSQGQQRQEMADLIPSITYSACLMCWSAAQQKSSEFCSRSCQEAAQDNRPMLLEALRGHVTFQEISDLFKNTWKTSRPCPEVLRVYKIVGNKGHAAKYEKFRKAHAKSTEGRRWHGTSCECDVGDPDEEDFCDSSECQLCWTVLHSFNTSKFKSGVHTSESSSQSSTYSDDGGCTEKAMLLIDVCFGEQIQLASDDIPPEGVKDYDTVQIIKWSNGQSSLVDDVTVWNTNAIRPSYLVFYG